MRAPHSPAAARSLTARIVTATGSLLILAGAVAGLPLLLAWVTPLLWAAGRDDLAHLLDRQDTGGAFLLLLLAVGWIGWAQFAFCAVRELSAQLRGRSWHAPRGLGASQRAAAVLIGGILVLLPTGSALATPAQAAPSATAAQLPGQAGTESATGDRAAPAADHTQDATYTVREARPAESLWSIAETELGDGGRWREIAALNEGRTMTGGEVFRANSFLQPGWQLQMPHTATAAAGDLRTQWGDDAPAVADGSEHVVTVRPGDYLSKIAQEELGDGNQWPKLYEASRGKPQPGGLPTITDPDEIYAGQQITVPGVPSDQHSAQRNSDDGEKAAGQEATPPATQTPDSHTPGDDAEDEQTPTPNTTTTPAPQSTPSTIPSSRPAEQPGQPGQPGQVQSPSATPSPSTSSAPPAASPSAASQAPNSAASSPAATTPVSTPPSSPLNLRTVLGAGALLAAAVTSALALRRTLQRRRRQPGETIAIAPQPSAAEAQLAAAAEPGGATRLDLALRTMAHQAAQEENGAALPALRAARIGARAVEVLPEDLAQEALAPFTTGRADWWVLAAGADLLDEETARQVPAPYPGLATIGSTAAGDLILLNLPRVPAVLLDGNPVHITEVCISLAVELGMSPWASDVQVVTVGFGEDLPHLLPTARITHMRQPAHALRDLNERLLEAHQLPDTRHQPYLLLCSAALDTDTAWELAEAIDKAKTVPVTLIAPASSTAAHYPDAEILNASLSTPQPLDSVGTDITVQRLEHAAYQQIANALTLSAQSAHPAEGPWHTVPDEPDSATPPQQTTPPEPPATPAADDASTSPPVPPAANGDNGIFPALLAATTDPSGLRLPPTAEPPPHAEASAPNADAAAPLAAEAPQSGERGAGDEAPVPKAEEECEAQDLHAPEIRVLGPIQVTGVEHTGHGPRTAQLAALLYFRPGRGADALCSAMDPVSPWSTATLNARIQGLRSCLGNDPAGNPYVPRRRAGEDPYRLSPQVRCDWTRFLQLAERALPLGPSGLPDLERALALVRGRPFGGRPLPWAEPYQQELITRITDVAHTIAAHRTPAGPHHDLTAARHAVTTGLEVDDTAELLYRDWLRIEHAAGNRQGLHTAITRIQHINRALDCSPEPETEQLINDLLGTRHPHRTQL
ncbi:LysM domain-containing protein [Streptomyces sp. 3213]|uniref:LysM peptidoglycan-binding domain-containing protein n=1 Tax=Streptomyces sp. 3213.3 TaxID=1855348 RepID=UPI000896631C|nr:LysM peptidoglycan-binding domain-containing protein [Streptomyces sp. 3213.3]SEC16905.1 LysM domain-containing protein [Streptomyces sp. 3213] [Streptomyces sp. 3213.3]